VNAGSGDPDCEDPVPDRKLVLQKEDSERVMNILSILKLPKGNLERYVSVDSTGKLDFFAYGFNHLCNLSQSKRDRLESNTNPSFDNDQKCP
jgi:hypothetical protein